VHLIVKKIADDMVVNEWIVTIVYPDEAIDPLRVTHTREWQSPSYLQNKEDTSLTEYSCDMQESECKVNLKIAPMLDGIESSQLTCEITTDFELVPTTEPCNPNTSFVPKWDHALTINILDKVRGTLLQSSVITIKNPEKETIDPTRVVTELVWQQPTYFLEKEDISRESYSCDTTKDLCRFNLQVLPKIDGVESSELTCKITTDFGTEEHDCNPSTIDVPEGNHALTIEVLEVATNIIISTRTLEIIGLTTPVPPSGGGGGWGGSVTLLDLSSAQIIVQSGLDESYVCRTDICQVNFDTRVPTGALCEWDFWGGIIETVWTESKCNPWYVKFATDAVVRLTIIDSNIASNIASNTLTRTISVKRKGSIATLENTSIFAHIDLQTKITANKKTTNTGIICVLGKAEKCSLNFTGEKSVGAKSWSWSFGDGATSDRENPGAHSFPIGTYTVRLVVSNWASSYESFYDVEVVRDFAEKLCTDCEKMKWKIQISAVLPNPPRADTVEWIELKNTSHETFSLDFCEISDDSKTHELSWIFPPGKTLRLRQAVTWITLGNSSDALSLKCGGFQIDSFVWNFTIPTNYILRREVLYWSPEQALITRVIDGDTMDATIAGVKTRIRLLGIDTPETVHPRKDIEKFWKEASDFADNSLEWKIVWLTYDHEPIDHYGRRLAYIWHCSGAFSETTCTLFNAQVVLLWYGRMERRFQFRLYDDFITFEKEAKDAKKGIWSDADFAKEMSKIASEEKELLTLEQEKEYLLLQEELIQECLEEESESCDTEISWQTITEKMSTLTVSPKKSWLVDISGRTWWDFPVRIEILQWENIRESFSLQSDEVGTYETIWLPRIVGEYTVRSILKKLHDADWPPEEELVTLEKKVIIEGISPHLTEALSGEIVLQGQMSDNRWQEGSVFHCRSRGSCSVNLTVETNREADVDYFWIFPDGSLDDRKNPGAIKVGYGQHEVLLVMSDALSEESIIRSIQIDHRPIPKKPKKPSARSSKYTLDLKDVPQDIGGGVVVEESTPWEKLVMSLAVLGLLSGAVYFTMRKSS
jgi:micrococcal nuclease